MSIGKTLSLLVGLVSALLVGAMMLSFHVYGWPRDTGLTVIAFSSLACGAVLALLHWVVMGWYEVEQRRLIDYVNSLGRDSNTGTIGAAPHASYRPRMGLNVLSTAVEQSVGQLRQRVEQLKRQRRELEVQLRICDAEREHAQAILNSISDAVIVTDAFNELALANESAARLLHFEREQALRRPIDQVISDPLLIKLIKDMREGAAPGNASLRRHIEHRIANGRAAPAVYDVTLASLVPQYDGPNGSGGLSAAAARAESRGVVTILRDVTREKEIAEMKSDFVSSVSHELRTPLSSIKAYLEMLLDGEADNEQTRLEFYHIIQGETNRLQRLIDNILNISRIESGVVKVQREHVSLPTLIKEAIGVMQPQARAKQIELLDVPTPLFFQVFADKDMIYQTLMNLIGNAIKYTPAGGRIAVSVDVDEHSRMVSVSVADTGVGIPPEDLPHVFEKFFRVNDHKKLAKGTGLGLNLVKQIVETVHNGKVVATSEVGLGSTFTFGLPMAENG